MARSIYFIFLFLILIGGNVIWAQAPVITSFSPSTGVVGSNVIITGSNFSSVPSENIVYISGVRANVTLSSPTSLTAVVPAASVYQPITVTVDTLTAFSNKPFTTTFSNGSLANSSFPMPQSVSATRYPCFGDFDNDGMVDMAGIYINNKITVYRNVSSPSNIEYETGPTYTLGSNPIQVIATDLDGDGKLDLVVIASLATYATIYRNTTIGNAISFGSPTYYSFGIDNYPYSIEANDIDRDGKADLIVGYVSSGYAFSVVRNTSWVGAISFAAKVNFSFGTVPGGSGNVGADNKVIVTDIDGDNKPDVTSLSRYFPPYLIYRNISTPGVISFAAKVAITSLRNTTIGNGYFDARIADLDGDNLPEIIYASSDSSYVSIYRNTSTTGNISYTSKLNFNASYVPIVLTINDMDGDGITDIGMLSYDSVVVFKNASSPGNIAIGLTRKYGAGYALQYITTADADADGKPDIFVSGVDVNNNNVNETKVLRNKVGEAIEEEMCPPIRDLIFQSNKNGITYQWQLNTGSGFTDISNNANYFGTNTNTLVLNSIPASFYGYEYRCKVDGSIYSETHIIKVVNRWTGNFNNVWENPANWSCGVAPETNTDVIINSGVVIINSIVTVRSMIINPSVNLSITTGGALHVLH